MFCRLLLSDWQALERFCHKKKTDILFSPSLLRGSSSILKSSYICLHSRSPIAMDWLMIFIPISALHFITITLSSLQFVTVNWENGIFCCSVFHSRVNSFVSEYVSKCLQTGCFASYSSECVSFPFAFSIDAVEWLFNSISIFPF